MYLFRGDRFQFVKGEKVVANAECWPSVGADAPILRQHSEIRISSSAVRVATRRPFGEVRQLLPTAIVDHVPHILGHLAFEPVVEVEAAVLQGTGKFVWDVGSFLAKAPKAVLSDAEELEDIHDSFGDALAQFVPETGELGPVLEGNVLMIEVGSY